MRADARRNRERLLAAADELVREHGPAVALDDIARRAGVGPGTLHRHFPAKEALLAALAVDRVRAVASSARDRLDAPDPAAALGETLRHMLAAGHSDAPLKAVLAADGFDLRTAAPEAAADLRDAVAAVLDRAQRAGEVRGDVDVDDVMALVAGAFAALGHVGDDPVRGERVVSVLLDGLREPVKVSARGVGCVDREHEP